jgi:hypothetical protein
MVETDTERGRERERERERSTPAVDPRPVKAKSNCRHLCDLQFDLAFFICRKLQNANALHTRVPRKRKHGVECFLFVESYVCLK